LTGPRAGASLQEPSGPEYIFEEARKWIAALSPNRRDFEHDVVGKSIFVGVGG
jgi:hypothetical protein